jgi:hypothetical protein
MLAGEGFGGALLTCRKTRCPSPLRRRCGVWGVGDGWSGGKVHSGSGSGHTPPRGKAKGAGGFDSKSIEAFNYNLISISMVPVP